MAYHCRDCSYTGTKRSESGGCPACGSADFGRWGARAAARPAASSPLKLLMLVLLWVWLITEIYRKLNAA